MRLTKSQLFGALALGVPVAVYLAWFWLRETRSLLGYEPWYQEDIQFQVGGTIGFVGMLLSPMLFGCLALVTARPSSSWAKQVRLVCLNILAFVSGLLGILAFFGTVAVLHFRPISVFLLWLPLAFGIYYVLAKESNPRTNLFRFGKTIATWTLVIVTSVLILSAAAIGLREIGAGTVGLVAIQLPFGLIPLYLAAALVNWFLAWWARRGGGKQLMAIGFYFHSAKWTPMPQDRAELEWAKMHHLPQGGQITSAWLLRDATLFRLECTDAQGERYSLLGNLPAGPWPQWMAGLFLLSTNSGPGEHVSKRRFRIFKRTEDPLTEMNPEQTATELAKLGESVSHLSPVRGWIHRDSSATRFALIDTEGHDFLIQMEIQQAEELTGVAGIFLLFAKAPTLASDTIDAPWSAPPETTSSPQPKTQP